jgi:hypothetical protein
MLRDLQPKKNKPIEIMTTAAEMKRGIMVTKDLAAGTVAAATSGLGDYFVSGSKEYTGIYSVVNPNDPIHDTIAAGAKCQVINTTLGERYANSEVTPGYADIGDPLNVSSGKLVRATSESAYQWIYGGTYADPTGTLYIVEKIEPATAPATRTVTYNSNGGSGTMTDPRSPYYVGKVVTVLPCEFTAPAYKDFVDWDAAANGSGTNYDPGDTITVAAANITLYAQYENTHTKLVLNANTGAGTMTDSTKYYEDDIIIVPDSTFTPPTSKKFSKWNTLADGTGTDYDPDDEIAVTSGMIGAATTLYAIWVDDE